MSNSFGGYHTYHGRSKARIVLTVIIVILLVVLLLAVAAFFLLQQYMVYSDDGTAYLDLPILQHSRETAAPSPSAGQDLVLVTPEPTPTPTPTPTPEPDMTAVWLLRDALTDGTVEEQVKAAGGNAVLLNMKADDGTLGYVSSLPQAIAMGTSGSDPDLNDAIQALTDSDLYTIARVSCFRDNLAPQKNHALAIATNSDYNWQDPDYIRWTNVSSADTRAYVIGVCQELAELGFDEILLDNACYPVEGHLNYIRKGDNYDPDDLSTPVEQFYREMADALKGTGVKLSIRASREVANGTDTLSGQSLSLLAQYADRVYLPAPGEEDDYALSEAGLKESQVVYTVSPDEDTVPDSHNLITQ